MLSRLVRSPIRHLTQFVALFTGAALAQQAPVPAPSAEPAKLALPLNIAPAAPEVARAILVSKRELTAQLQIFLDQQMFSPGSIDGISGRFLTNALKRWQRAHDLPETGVVDENVPIDSVYPIYAFHTFDNYVMIFVL